MRWLRRTAAWASPSETIAVGSYRVQATVEASKTNLAAKTA
jgi:hypothetical protein